MGKQLCFPAKLYEVSGIININEVGKMWSSLPSQKYHKQSSRKRRSHRLSDKTDKFHKCPAIFLNLLDSMCPTKN